MDTRIPLAEPAPDVRTDVLTGDDVKFILRKHREYLKGMGGERACFEHRHLKGVRFRGSLARAQFHRARFEECSFDADVDLTETDFSGADLRRMDFTGTTNLAEHRLGASYLAYAKLPDSVKFAGLETLKGLTERSEKILYAVLASCAAVLILTLLGKHDDFFRQTGAISLPVLSMPVPIRAFYFLAPWVLLALQSHFVATVLRLWSTLRDLPAVLPNNRFVYREVPSFPNFCVMPFGTWWPVFPVPGSEDSKQSVADLTRWERGLVTFLVWWLVPLTITGVWWMYLPSHDWTGTMTHLAAMMLSTFLSVHSYAQTVSSLKRGLRAAVPKQAEKETGPSRRQLSVRVLKLISDTRRDIATGDFVIHPAQPAADGRPGVDNIPPKVRIGTVLLMPVSAGLALAAMSLWALMEGGCNDRLGRVSESPGRCYWRAADLQDAEMDSLVLRHRNLRRAFFRGASLVKTDMEEAHLEGALFSGAKMYKVSLKDARLDNAIFWETDLRWARLKEAHLEGADLRGADLRGARLQGAHLAGADLRGANLDGAILCGADLGRSDTLGTTNRARFSTDSVQQFRKTLRAGSIWPGTPETSALATPWDSAAAALGTAALNDGERREYARWLTAQGAVERLAADMEVAAQRRVLSRDSLVAWIDQVDVSMGASTQRRKEALLEGIRRMPPALWTRNSIHYAQVAPGTQEFINAVQSKAANHCVALRPIRLPTPAPFFDLRPAYNIAKVGVGFRTPG